MTNQPTTRNEPTSENSQPATPPEPGPEKIAVPSESAAPAPGLLMFNAESENACTDDGCMVTFTKG